MLLAVVFAVLVARLSWRTVAGEVRSISGFHAVELHGPILREAARESRVDPNLLAGIMLAESTGRVGAESSAMSIIEEDFAAARKNFQITCQRDESPVVGEQAVGKEENAGFVAAWSDGGREGGDIRVREFLHRAIQKGQAIAQTLMRASVDERMRKFPGQSLGDDDVGCIAV